MSVCVMQQWSVRVGDQALCETALAQIAEHIRDDHPEIVETAWFTQYVGPLAHRGFLWIERYDSLTAIEAGRHTADCDIVWARVHELVQEGTHVRSIWSAA